jgi:hypothetical protein
MGCPVHCPRPSTAGGRLAAVVIGGGAALAAVNAVLGDIVIAASCAVAAAVTAGVVVIRREMRQRVSTRAEVVSALLAVRGVPPDPAAIAARARQPRGQLAAPAVRLVEVRPAAHDGKVER